jgi:hypothetical protein
MHGEILRLLFLQAHPETETHFTATGMPSQHNQSDSFRFKRAAFYQSLKSKVGCAPGETGVDKLQPIWWQIREEAPRHNSWPCSQSYPYCALQAVCSARSSRTSVRTFSIDSLRPKRRHYGSP